MSRVPQVKVFLSEPEHAQVRLAAAYRGQSMTQFAREIVLDEAHRVTEHLHVGEVPEPSGIGHATRPTRRS